MNRWWFACLALGTFNVGMGLWVLHDGDAWGFLNLAIAVGTFLIWVFSRFQRTRRERELARTGGYRNCRDFEHWKHWVDRVYEIHNELAKPLGMVLTINHHAEPGTYFLYLDDPAGHRRQLHGVPSATTMLAGSEWLDDIKDPEHGDRWLAEAVTAILSAE
jgi:hypothetical protein